MMDNSSCFFENRECEYFPCHSGLEHYNCLFCYCPLYHMKNCPGTPKFMEYNGKQIKVCSDCVFPHKPENYEGIMKALKG